MVSQVPCPYGASIALHVDAATCQQCRSQCVFHNVRIEVFHSFTNGGFVKWGYPQTIHFDGVFHYKPTILGYPHDYGTPQINTNHFHFQERRSIFPNLGPATALESDIFSQVSLAVEAARLSLTKNGMHGRNRRQVI